MPKTPGHALPQPSAASSEDVSEASARNAPAATTAPGLHSLVSLLERLPDAVLVLDREWRLTFANEEAIRISRLTPSDFNSRTHWEMYPETLGTPVERAYREAMRIGITAHIEHYYQPFDVWLDIHILTIPDGLALHYRDITDRKRAESLGDASLRKLEQVLEAVSDSIVCIDRDWNCTFANRAALTILRTNTLIGENLWTRFPGNNDEPFASNYRSTMERRIPTEF